jgi:N-acetyl-anhydromuramoyl-L-alanine amidase
MARAPLRPYPVKRRRRLTAWVRDTFDDEGRARFAVQLPSPNQDARPDGVAIELVVVHGISLPPGRFGGRAIQRLFTNTLPVHAHPYFATLADVRVSAHFLIHRGGRIVQFVPCARRAWHAGASQWRGRERCNDFSIGIELEGGDDVAYTGPQYASLARLVHALARRYPVREVVGHGDIAPGRKTDPGPAFEWRRLAHALPPDVHPAHEAVRV